MNDEIRQLILDVADAIDRLNEAFKKRAEALHQAGEGKEFQQWLKATHAMGDSGHIYLSWARHYAGVSEEGSAAEESDLEESLDEGSTWSPEERSAT